jgi:putative transposase
MPSGLKRFQHARQLHYITFTCYHRTQRLNAPAAKELFEQTLERIRRWYGSCVYGYVVMPEHVHLLVSEPERGDLAVILQMLKQIVARKRNPQAGVEVFWQRRCYDFNVWSERKFKEKLRYIHCNPVRRGRVEKAEDWPWSSFRHYLAGVEGRVEIESQWTARKQERLGIFPQVKIRHED